MINDDQRWDSWYDGFGYHLKILNSKIKVSKTKRINHTDILAKALPTTWQDSGNKYCIKYDKDVHVWFLGYDSIFRYCLIKNNVFFVNSPLSYDPEISAMAIYLLLKQKPGEYKINNKTFYIQHEIPKCLLV